MIYGEETETIDFSKGLWITDSKDLHPGYCSTLRNLIVTPNGTLWPRPSFLNVFASYVSSWFGTKANAGSFAPYRSQAYWNRFVTRPSVLKVVGSSFDVPVFIESHDNLGVSGAGARNLRTVNRAVTTGRYLSKENHQLANGLPVSNYIQYSDRIYAYFTSSGIRRISGWNYNTAANVTLTETAIGGSPSFAASIYTPTLLEVYKDRLFLIDGNKVYFTEVAAVGGYPETWNPSTNFIILPVTSIVNSFIFNNIMYLFTTNGVWTLQVQGAPEAWLLKQINESICTSHMGGSCFNDGVFYYSQLNEIYAFNGYDRPISISQPINEYLLKCRGIGVFAFERGCIVCAEIYIPDPTDTDFALVGETKLFYFNGATWCEIDFNYSDNENYISSIVGTSILVSSDLTNQRPSTFITILQTDGATYAMRTYFVDSLNYVGDALTMGPTDGTITATIPIRWELVPAPISKDFLKEKRHKRGYLSLLSTAEDYPIDYSISVDGAEFTPVGELQLEKEFPSEDRNFLVQFEVDTFARRLQMKFQGWITQPSPTTGLVSNVVGISVNSAPLEITSLSIIGNTGRNEAEDASG